MLNKCYSIVSWRHRSSAQQPHARARSNHRAAVSHRQARPRRARRHKQAGYYCSPAGTPSEGFIREILWRRSGVIVVVGDTNELLARGLNDRGQVVGVTRPPTEHGFVWTRGRFRDIGDLPGGADRSSAADINNLGQVVGFSDTAAGREATLWEHGNLMPLGDLPGGATNSQATAINELGAIVGVGSTNRGFRPFVWQGGVMKQLRLPPELRQAASAGASDINQSGVIVGSADGIPLVWPRHDQDGVRLPLLTGFPNANASAINDRGDIVGSAFEVDQNGEVNSRAVIWRNNGTRVSTLQALVVDNDPCGLFERAVDINQRGEIAVGGEEICVTRSSQAYRLVPVQP
jgi:probable HAF family extracellular repeat protein